MMLSEVSGCGGASGCVCFSDYCLFVHSTSSVATSSIVYHFMHKFVNRQ